MVFRVEAKTALGEAGSWVRIAKGRLNALAAQDSDNPAALQEMARELAAMYDAINDISTRLAGVDEEWTQLFAPSIPMGTLKGFPNPPAMGSGQQSCPSPDAIAPRL